MKDLEKFLQIDKYVDYDSALIRDKAAELFSPVMSAVEKGRIAYEFVRDEIPHSFDCAAEAVTAKASDVLRYRTGICHAKANLLAALLRSQGIPTGFCYQRLTLLDDDSMGYCLHGYNAVWQDERWIYLDARGNKPGVNARFSTEKPMLAFPVREEYDEYFIKGIFASPDPACMQMLERAKSVRDVMQTIPDQVTGQPDLIPEDTI